MKSYALQGRRTGKIKIGEKEYTITEIANIDYRNFENEALSRMMDQFTRSATEVGVLSTDYARAVREILASGLDTISLRNQQRSVWGMTWFVWNSLKYQHPEIKIKDLEEWNYPLIVNVFMEIDQLTPREEMEVGDQGIPTEPEAQAQ